MKKLLFQSAIVASTLNFCSVVVAQDNGASGSTKVAIEVARAALAKELSLDVTTLDVISSDRQIWPDSSLGCGQRGSTAAQVVTPGYEVIFKTPHGNYRVHATEKYAVVCGAATQWRKPRNVGIPLKDLNPMIERARQDLAMKLNAKLLEISTVNYEQATWPDSSMDCPVTGESIKKQTTKGYRIALRYAGRVYIYHTDLNRVRACPAIEVN